MYKFLAGDKVGFLDDILIFLESSIEQQNEDLVASASCYNTKNNSIFGLMYTFKPFLTKGKERLYLRIAMLHLEKEGFIQKLPNPKDIELPIYLITYSGVILVRNGGYSKKLVLDNIKSFLQCLAWFVTLLALLLNVYINRDKLTFSCTSTNQEKVLKVNPLKAKEIQKQRLKE